MITVTDIVQCKEISKAANRTHIIFCDTETTGLDPHTCKLLLMSLRFDGETYVIDLSKLGVDALELFRPALENPRIIKVFHNAVFDYKFLWHHGNIDTSPIRCTLIAEQILKAGYLGVSCSLANVSMRRLNRTLDKSTRDQFIGKKDEITETQYTYAATDVIVLEPIYYQQLEEIRNEDLGRVYDLEMELIPVTSLMEWTGIDIDRKKLNAAIPVFEDKLRHVDRTIQDYVINEGLSDQIVIDKSGYTAVNTASVPQMLGVVNAFGIDVGTLNNKELKDWDTKWSMGTHEIDDSELFDDEEDDEFNLGFEHPFLKLTAARSALSKILKTYLVGLQSRINPITNRIHAGFNQCGAMRTGRYSSTNPNLQNLPNSGKLKNLGLGEYDIRSMFISGEGHKFIISDYSAIELVILAAMSKDPNLLEQLQHGDIHTFVANTLFETHFTKAMAEEEPYKTFRHSSKTITYAIIYGTTGFNLYRTLSTPLSTCGFKMNFDMGDKWIALWKSLFPTTGDFLDDSGRHAIRELYTTSILGRRRHWSYDQLRNIYQVARAMREGTNAKIQSSSADMTKLAELKFYKECDPKKAQLVASVHDELLIRVKDEWVDDYKIIIKYAMESAGQQLFPDLPAGMISVTPKVSFCYDK